MINHPASGTLPGFLLVLTVISDWRVAGYLVGISLNRQGIIIPLGTRSSIGALLFLHNIR